MLPRRKTLRKLSPCSGISWRHSPFALHPAQSFLEVKLQLGRLQQVGIGIDLTSIHWCWFSRPQALPGTKVRRTDVTTWDNKLLGWIWTGKYFVLVVESNTFTSNSTKGRLASKSFEWYHPWIWFWTIRLHVAPTTTTKSEGRRDSRNVNAFWGILGSTNLDQAGEKWRAVCKLS